MIIPAGTGLLKGEEEVEKAFPGINLGLNLKSRHKPGTLREKVKGCENWLKGQKFTYMYLA